MDGPFQKKHLSAKVEMSLIHVPKGGTRNEAYDNWHRPGEVLTWRLRGLDAIAATERLSPACGAACAAFGGVLRSIRGRHPKRRQMAPSGASISGHLTPTKRSNHHALLDAGFRNRPRPLPHRFGVDRLFLELDNAQARSRQRLFGRLQASAHCRQFVAERRVNLHKRRKSSTDSVNRGFFESSGTWRHPTIRSFNTARFGRHAGIMARNSS